ncbi:ABC transporter permease [Candidatus Uabimicrobium amorphum]|uniref:ABC transporter permease n=1 Tax=Uabimicrobium amorphum TaxID=2596890 RepID=A0A5S9ITB3_UABAM|nr:FtsX-like permease family protein [Candidatus Uabimicrobium amorphum]BBM86760.1 ABC transporter permease [Candidatus Uabimicrobium amorphum]
MKNTYILRYSWKDIWHTTNRPFTLINIIAIVVSVTTLVLLLGGLQSFEDNRENKIDAAGLAIEATSYEESKISQEQRESLAKLANVKSSHWWKPTLFVFYKKKGGLFEKASGQTIDLQDPILENLKDVRNNARVTFLDKSKIKDSAYDEIGIIIPFGMLKQLKYLPEAVNVEQEKTWKHIPLPKTIRVRIKEKGLGGMPMIFDLPIIGIVDDKTLGRYLVTKECYEMLGLQWNTNFMPHLKKRDGSPLFPDQKPTNTPPPSIQRSADTHVSVYVDDRQQLLPVLRKIRVLGLRASSALEFFLQDYQQQETFFIAAASGICFALFLFTGVILFATFYALTLRKRKEIGILKSCGASSWLVTKIFVLQALNIGFLAISVGIASGVLLGSQLSQYAKEKLDTNVFSMPEQYLVFIFGYGLLFCLLVTFIPVRMAVKVDADTVIRAN